MAAQNSEHTIVTSVLSLQRQTLPEWELIVVDDASSDHTSQLLQSLSHDDPRIVIAKNATRSGTGASRAAGVHLARAPIVAFLDSDDLWLPNRLKEALAFMESHDYRWVHSAFQYLHPSGRLSDVVMSRRSSSFKTILGTNPIALSSALLRREEFPMDLSYRFSTGQDWQMWVRLAATGLTPQFLESPGVIYRLRADSLSGKKLHAARQRLKTILTLGLGPVVTLTSYMNYLVGSTQRLMRRFKLSKDSAHLSEFVEALEQSSRTLRANILSNIGT